MSTISHGVTQSIPAVEIAYHADSLRIGCPHRKETTLDAIDGSEMGTQKTPGMLVATFVEQVEVQVSNLWTEAVWRNQGML